MKTGRYARPGSALWLLGHELRMFFINASGVRSKDRSARKNIAIWVVLALLAHGFAYMVLRKLGAGFGAGGPPHTLIMAVTGIMAGAFTLMLSTGLKSSVEVLFERGDMDLLLSSPLPSRSIFSARLAGIAGGTCALYLLFLAPFAHAGLVLGQFHWLGIYPAILSLAAIAASLSMLLTLALVRWLGVRRTRVVAQILGALAGALLFLVSQALGTTLGEVPRRALAALAPMAGPDHLLWLPSRALLGSAPAALAMAAAGVLAFWLTAGLTHRFFVHGVQQAVSVVRAAKAPPGGLRFRFGRSLTHAILLKEWRLILRDPQLISQVLLQLLYLLPMFAPLYLGRAPSLAGNGAAIVFLCAALSASLGWLIIAAEDAPDLLRAAPCNPGAIRRAKLAAAMLPPLALVALALAWFAPGHPAAAATMLATAIPASACATLVVLWCGRPAPRGDFKLRGKSSLLGTILEMFSGMCWAGLSFVLQSRLGAGAWSGLLLLGGLCALLGAMLVLGTAWLFRQKTG